MRLLACLVLCVASCLTGVAARAEIIQIQINGLGFNFAGGQIYDSVDAAGRTSNLAQATPIQSVEFYKDSVFVGRLDSNLYADLLVDQVPNLPANGGLVTSGSSASPDGSFGFDLLVGGNSPSQLLSLNLDSLDVLYSKSKVVLIGGDVKKLIGQSLPFGLTLDKDSTISIDISSSSMKNVTTSAGYVTGFQAFGSAQVSGQSGPVAPEPATWTLLSIAGMVGLGLWRKKNR